MTKNYEIGLAVLVFTYLVLYIPMIYVAFKMRKNKSEQQDNE